VTENPSTTKLADSTSVLPILSVRHLVKHFPVRGGILRRTSGQVHAVDDVSFDIYPGETLGLVGESGCGKTTVGRTTLRIVLPTSGAIVFDGRDLATLTGDERKAFRRSAQMIFQDPFSSLDPRWSVEHTIREALDAFDIGDAPGLLKSVAELLGEKNTSA
jgi:oligopeptide transport system ATP-binding protein